MTELFALNADQARQLRELLAAYSRGELRGSLQTGSRRSLDPGPVEFGKADAKIDGITSAGSTALESGTIHVYTLNSTGGAIDANFDVTAYNLSTIAITTTAWVQVRRHRSGHYIVSAVHDQVFKPLIRVTANSSFSQGSSQFTATIKNQWGPGIEASTANNVTVRNFQTSTSTDHLFAGASGAAFIALWDDSTTYTAIQGECT